MTASARPSASARALADCTTPAACVSALAARLSAHPGTLGEAHPDGDSLVFELADCWDVDAYLTALPSAHRVVGTTRIVRVPVTGSAVSLWSELCDAFEAAVRSPSVRALDLAECGRRSRRAELAGPQRSTR